MNPSRRKGFTLIEVLIAMTLLSVMVVLLFSSLRIAAESWNAGENKVNEVNNKAVVYQFFKRHIASVRPLPMLDNEQDFTPDAQQAFQGYMQSLSFVAALPASSARKGLQVFTIALDSNNPSTLLVNLTSYRQADNETVADSAPTRPEVLLEHVDALRFSYFGKTEDVAEPQWRDEWTVADRLPSLIKVSIGLADGSYWPDMVFALKISEAANPDAVTETEMPQNGSADVP